MTTRNNEIPTSPHDVTARKSSPWACCTTNVLDLQGVKWTLESDDTQFMIDAFNYGDGIVIDNVIANVGTMTGKIFTDNDLGAIRNLDVILQKGVIAELNSTDANGNTCDSFGELYLKISAFVHINFTKYTGYMRFQCAGKVIVSISFHVLDSTLEHYGDDWASNLQGIYNGRQWKK